jgi:hypothetical protein
MVNMCQGFVTDKQAAVCFLERAWKAIFGLTNFRLSLAWDISPNFRAWHAWMVLYHARTSAFGD